MSHRAGRKRGGPAAAKEKPARKGTAADAYTAGQHQTVTVEAGGLEFDVVIRRPNWTEWCEAMSRSTVREQQNGKVLTYDEPRAGMEWLARQCALTVAGAPLDWDKLMPALGERITEAVVRLCRGSADQEGESVAGSGSSSSTRALGRTSSPTPPSTASSSSTRSSEQAIVTTISEP